MSEQEAIEQAILCIRAGQPHAVSALIGLAYRRLYDIASRLAPRPNRKGPTPTLHATALLNESSLRMYDPKLFERVANAEHFFAIFATATRHALIDHQRNRKARKRGGGFIRQPLEMVLNQLHEEGIDIVELNDELENLRSVHSRCADVMEMHYFGGMTVAEIAKQLDLSISTIEADLRFGRAFLGREKSSE